MTRGAVIIGAGPAGLMAAEMLSAAGHAVTVYEHRPSAARKFLMAGRGGLNLTHSEDLDKFIGRYGAAADWLAPMIRDFPPQALRDWCEGLGEETFTGSSGRVFPRSFKASPLLRAWLARLESRGVRLRYGWRWAGWGADGALSFVDDAGAAHEEAASGAVLLALGGASWPRLGSDAGWVAGLRARGVTVVPFRPANCGFAVDWSPYIREKHAGRPLKPVGLSCGGVSTRAEAVVTEKGLEGGGIYALAAPLRDMIERDGRATLMLDLHPGLSVEALAQRLGAPRGRDSFGTVLRKRAGLSPVAASVLRECTPDAATLDPGALAARIKAVPVTLTAPFAIERAISSAGGIARDELDDDMMLRRLPGVFAAGEMIDWEAPTGGYLLQAAYATAVRAARGMDRYMAVNRA